MDGEAGPSQDVQSLRAQLEQFNEVLDQQPRREQQESQADAPSNGSQPLPPETKPIVNRFTRGALEEHRIWLQQATVAFERGKRLDSIVQEATISQLKLLLCLDGEPAVSLKYLTAKVLSSVIFLKDKI